MDRVVLAFALVACGARTDLGGLRGDAGVVVDASEKDVVVEDVAPSKCPPVEYGDETLNRPVFAIDDVAIYYWLEPNCDLWRATKDGTSVSMIVQAPDCSSEIAVDDLHVYWTSISGHLMSQSKNGTPGIGDLGCASLGGCPANVQLRAIAKDVVIVDDGARPVAMPKTKTPGLPYPLAAKGIAPPAPIHYVVTDDKNAYWNTDIRVFASALDGSGSLEYATFSLGLAIDSSHVYWTANDKGAFDLFRANKDGTSTTLLSTSDTDSRLVANDAFVYGGSPAGITKQPTSGGTPIVIVPDVHPNMIALDDACIYFAESSDAGWRITRAPN